MLMLSLNWVQGSKLFVLVDLATLTCISLSRWSYERETETAWRARRGEVLKGFSVKLKLQSSNPNRGRHRFVYETFHV